MTTKYVMKNSAFPLQSNTFSLFRKQRKNTPPFGRGAVRRQFSKPDIFPSTITTCSSGQKAGLTQSSSLELSVHTSHKSRCMSHVIRITRQTAVSDLSKFILCLVAPRFESFNLRMPSKCIDWFKILCCRC
jgi:hypothetical protein